MFINMNEYPYDLLINTKYIQMIKIDKWDEDNDAGEHLYHAMALCMSYGTEKPIDIWQCCTTTKEKRDQEVEWFYDFFREGVNQNTKKITIQNQKEEQYD